MTYRLFLSVLLCGIVLAVTSCSDPAGVGANLGDTPVNNDDVEVRSIPADSIYTVENISITGLQLSPTTETGQSSRNWRFLFGAVNDPLSGPITAEGYVDFSGTTQRDSAFSAASSEDLNAELRLQTSYAHGDTASTLDVQIYDLAAEAEMDGAPADTTFEAEPTAIDSYQKSPTDSLLRFPLPQSWIEKHQEVFQDSLEFGDAFNGLKLSASSGEEVVVGVEHASATLRLTTSEDTVDFRSLKSFTHLDRKSQATVPDGRTLLLDGVGQRLGVQWDFDQSLFTDTLRNVPLNRANLRVPIDTAKMKEEVPSANFARPSVAKYRIFGELAEGISSCGQAGARASTLGDRICLLSPDPSAPAGTVRLAPRFGRTLFEEVLSGTSFFTRFQVAIATQESESSQNAIQRGLPSTLPVLVKSEKNFEAETRPHVRLVYTPL